MFFLDFQEKYLFLKRNYESKKKKISEFIFHLNEHFIFLYTSHSFRGNGFFVFYTIIRFSILYHTFHLLFPFLFFPKNKCSFLLVELKITEKSLSIKDSMMC